MFMMANLKILLSIRTRIIGDLKHHIQEIEGFTSETNVNLVAFRDIALEKAFKEFNDITNEIETISTYENASRIRTENLTIKSKYIIMKSKLTDFSTSEYVQAIVSTLHTTSSCYSNKKMLTSTSRVYKLSSTPIDSNLSHLQVPKFEQQRLKQQQSFNSYDMLKPPINTFSESDSNHPTARLTILQQPCLINASTTNNSIESVRFDNSTNRINGCTISKTNAILTNKNATHDHEHWQRMNYNQNGSLREKFKWMGNGISFPLFLLLFEQPHKLLDKQPLCDETILMFSLFETNCNGNSQKLSDILKEQMLITSIPHSLFRGIKGKVICSNDLCFTIASNTSTLCTTAIPCEHVSSLQQINTIFCGQKNQKLAETEHQLVLNVRAKRKHSVVTKESMPCRNFTRSQQAASKENRLTTRLRMMYEATRTRTIFPLITKMHIENPILEKLWVISTRWQFGMTSRRPKLKWKSRPHFRFNQMLMDKKNDASIHNGLCTFLMEQPPVTQLKIIALINTESRLRSQSFKKNTKPQPKKTFKSSTIYTHTIPSYRQNKIHS